MKPFIKLTVLFVIICTFATQNNYTYCQAKFAPIGAQWYYKYIEKTQSGVLKYYNIQFTSEKDTIIEGKTCRIIRGNYLKSGGIPYSEIIYEENGIVYYYFNNQFRKIFDFTVEEGDTVEFEFKGHSNYSSVFDTTSIVQCLIEKIELITIDDIVLKKIFAKSLLDSFSTTGYFNHIYYEKIGNEVIDWNFFTVLNPPGLEDYSLRLNCYNDTDIHYTANWWQLENKPCDFSGTITSINEKEDISNPIQIFPNPAQDKLNIQFVENFNIGQITITVYDIMGKIVFEKEYLSEPLISVDVQNLIAGCYFLKINNKTNIVLTNKFIKL